MLQAWREAKFNSLPAQVEKVKALYEEDIKVGYAGVFLGGQLERVSRSGDGADPAVVLSGVLTDLRSFDRREQVVSLA